MPVFRWKHPGKQCIIFESKTFNFYLCYWLRMTYFVRHERKHPRALHSLSPSAWNIVDWANSPNEFLFDTKSKDLRNCFLLSKKEDFSCFHHWNENKMRTSYLNQLQWNLILRYGIVVWTFSEKLFLCPQTKYIPHPEDNSICSFCLGIDSGI